jgi:CheY-like chemotaxis protein
MAQILALVDDLFFQAKILETAKHLGITVRTATTGDALLAEMAKEAPKLVIVDLNARGMPVQAIERVCAAASGVPLIAFLSHVQTALAQQARAAGCTQVMPRSQFTRDLATILAQAKPVLQRLKPPNLMRCYVVSEATTYKDFQFNGDTDYEDSISTAAARDCRGSLGAGISCGDRARAGIWRSGGSSCRSGGHAGSCVPRERN